MQMSIPVMVVRTGKRKPNYINPFVKVLLAKRNKFRRQGNAAADILACAINNITANNIRSRMRKLANAPVKELWSAVRLIVLRMIAIIEFVPCVLAVYRGNGSQPLSRSFLKQLVLPTCLTSNLYQLLLFCHVLLKKLLLIVG
jgi:hypothetical protein